MASRTIITLLILSIIVVTNALTIYLHVGPHKTGTSHIQHYLELNRNLLAEEKICLPKVIIGQSSLESRGKAQNRIVEDITQLKNFSSAVWEPLQECVSRQMNILISAENLCTFTKSDIQVMKRLLSNLDKAVKFKVIIYYREWFSRTHSTFAEVYKKNELKIASYSEFLFLYLDKFLNSPQLNTRLLVEGYGSVFGQENLIIVDYDGVNAAKKDIAFVFVCEVLGILCSKASRLNIAATHENEKPNMAIVQFIYLLKFFVHSHRLRFCAFDVGTIHELIRVYRDRDFKFPLNTPRLQHLRNYSIAEDNMFRKEYSSLIHYNNQSAAMEILNDFVIEEINLYSFYESGFWMNTLGFELERLKKIGKICNLDGRPHAHRPPPPPAKPNNKNNNNDNKNNKPPTKSGKPKSKSEESPTKTSFKGEK